MNYDNEHISDEELNAFLDDQLDTRERARVLDAIHRDSSISQRVNELRLLRDMVQHAYEQLPGQAERAPNPQARREVLTRWSVAACLVLCFGIVLGWYGHERVLPEQLATAPVQAEDSGNLIIHLSSSAPYHINAALDMAEQTIARRRAGGQDYNVEIIANNGGLDLVREDVSVYRDRIQKLVSNDDNVRVLACAKAMRRLQQTGVDVELLPEVGIAPSALDQIILRMQADWHYIKA